MDATFTAKAEYISTVDYITITEYTKKKVFI